jgi:hypothetical protein
MVSVCGMHRRLAVSIRNVRAGPGMLPFSPDLSRNHSRKNHASISMDGTDSPDEILTCVENSIIYFSWLK